MEEGVGEREKMNLVILPHQLAAGGSEPATDAVGISLLLLDSLLSFFLSFFLSFSLSFFRFFLMALLGVIISAVWHSRTALTINLFDGGN